VAVAFGFALVVAVSAEVRFLIRAGYEEVRLLLRRRSLARLVADDRTPPGLRSRFELVLAARTFGADSLGLKAGDTYTTYANVGRDTLVLVMSASPRLTLSVYTWWFPIVGAVPYHGYFSLDAARQAASRLEAQGYDTYVRPAAAFSTLGWFSDPLVSSAIARDSVALVSTVIHEISHNTLYVPSATEFDESFANFVGMKGAEAFFRARGEVALADRAAAEWRDEIRLADFYSELSRELESVYGRAVADSTRLRLRQEVFRVARDRLTSVIGPRFEAYRAEWFAARELNNATVIAQRIYRDRLELFDRILGRFGGDVRATVGVIEKAVRGGQGGRGGQGPFEALEALMATDAAPAGGGGSR
jgi:predicted aminopeptidase